MPLDLDRLQQRIVGVLIEKELAVPESYPMTLNQLVAGSNQKSNREPVMSVETYEVEGALHALMDAGWIVSMEKAGARTVRYEHRAREQLGLEEVDLAILAELLCRGPQAPGALKTRIARMRPVDSPAAIEGRLREMAARPVPYVRSLERRPREHAARWEHCLGATGEAVEAPAPPAELDAPAPEEPPLFAPAPEPEPLPLAPEPTPTPPPAVALPAVIEELTDRVEALEQLVRDLTERVDRMEGV